LSPVGSAELRLHQRGHTLNLLSGKQLGKYSPGCGCRSEND